MDGHGASIRRRARFFLQVAALASWFAPAPAAVNPAPHVRVARDGTRQIGMVTPTILGMTIDAQTVTPHKLSPYVAAPFGDSIATGTGSYSGQPNVLTRGRHCSVAVTLLCSVDADCASGGGGTCSVAGTQVGWVIGPANNALVTWESVNGTAITQATLDSTGTYSISSTDDVNYATPQAPTAVARKTQPTIMTSPLKQFLVCHTVYLTLPSAPVEGKTYTITTTGISLAPINWKFTPTRDRSEAVHAIQTGYRIDDPVKRAYLSLWKGTGGATSYAAAIPFRVIDVATGTAMYSGTAGAAFTSGTTEGIRGWSSNTVAKNRNGTDVLPLDFSALTTSGTYRVCVNAIGCSYPFRVGGNPWMAAFKTQLAGFLNTRSGIAVGFPNSIFSKPIDLKSGSGIVPTTIYQTTRTVMDNTTVAAEQATKGSLLPAAATATQVPEAWGGYHDAGDYNPRRVTHLPASMALMEVFDTSPAFFSRVATGAPVNQAGIPPMLDEALWGIEVFKRLQDTAVARGDPSGSIPFAIESNGDPAGADVSWVIAPTGAAIYVYSSGPATSAGDPYSSWLYAAAAARFSRLVQPYSSSLASTYSASATAAANFAETVYAARIAAGGAAFSDIEWFMFDARMLCATEMLAMTAGAAGSTWDVRAHGSDTGTSADNLPLSGPLYLFPTHDSSTVAYAYARLPSGVGTSADKTTLKNMMGAECTINHNYQLLNAFNIPAHEQTQRPASGFYAAPDVQDCTRAHALLGTASYLADAVRGAHFSLGANASNTTYLTGIGWEPPQHPVKRDARYTGQPAPVGVLVDGNLDYQDPDRCTNTYFNATLGNIDQATVGGQQGVLAVTPGAMTPALYVTGTCSGGSNNGTACLASDSNCTGGGTCTNVCNSQPWPVNEMHLDVGFYPAQSEAVTEKLDRNILVWGYLASRP